MSERFSSDPVVALVAADAEVIAALRPARETLDSFAVRWRENLVSAAGAGTFDATGLRAVIVASPDAALPGALAAASGLPVVRVPTAGADRTGLGLLHDATAANLPAGETAFATMAIGDAGAKNAALFVVAVLGRTDERLWGEWLAFRQRQTDAVLNAPPLADV